MTFWEFGTCVAGWNRVQSGGEEKPDPISDQEFDEIKRKAGLG